MSNFLYILFTRGPINAVQWLRFTRDVKKQHLEFQRRLAERRKNRT